MAHPGIGNTVADEASEHTMLTTSMDSLKAAPKLV